ncbi:MAG: hypothetical protein Kow00109_28560 [Acidobacteriota bacterium]
MLHLLFTGDVQGSFEPCGCAGGPTGGLARRAGYARSLEGERSGVIHIDAGNYLAPPGPDADRVNRLMIRSLEMLPIAAMNLGADDTYWWRKLAPELRARTQLVAANLEPRRDDVPAPGKYTVQEFPIPGREGKAFRIAFVGLVDPVLVKPISGFRGQDPTAALRAVLPELRGKTDWIVVLLDTVRRGGVPPEGSLIRRLVEAAPEIDVLITTEKRFVKYEPVEIGKTLILSSIERGRFLGDLQLFFDEAGRLVDRKVEFVEMKIGVPEDPALLEEQRILHELLGN